MQTKSITIEIYGETEALLSSSLQEVINHIEKGEKVGNEFHDNQGYSFAVDRYYDNKAPKNN